ncbi:hypothetical protein ERJ75_000241300 [Trypanosoma vivax]|nr:hypothetical protein TRVL_01663 [Trypanosoma vivax]KAH8618709.1 hypothetical protein ERJ75_000241300 [Trypanosoma vivax]
MSHQPVEGNTLTLVAEDNQQLPSQTSGQGLDLPCNSQITVSHLETTSALSPASSQRTSPSKQPSLLLKSPASSVVVAETSFQTPCCTQMEWAEGCSDDTECAAAADKRPRLEKEVEQAASPNRNEDMGDLVKAATHDAGQLAPAQERCTPHV